MYAYYIYPYYGQTVESDFVSYYAIIMTYHTNGTKNTGIKMIAFSSCLTSDKKDVL
jgi:hypothetical protein